MKNLLILLAVLITIPAIMISFRSRSVRIITGQVVSESNNPLSGALVYTGYSNLTTNTDSKGKFTIGVPEEAEWLKVFLEGYIIEEVFIKGVDTVKVILKKEIQIEDNAAYMPNPPIVKQDVEVMTTHKEIRSNPQVSNTMMQYNTHSATTFSLHSTQISHPQNTEDYGHIQENSFHTPQDAPLSTFSVDVDKAAYTNVRRFLVNGQMPPVDAVRIEEMVNYFDYDYPQPTGQDPISIVTESGQCPWNTSHKLVHIGLQTKTMPVENLPASNLVFLLDVSGSMNSPNKLPLVISSFKMLADQLRQKDRVAIVVYAGSSGLVLPSVAGSRKAEIYEALGKLRAGGSTGGAEGIQLAYKVAREHFIPGGNNRVILATDGDFNVGVNSDAELVRLIEKERESGVYLSVLGFGIGNYKDSKMQALADNGNGNHSYIDNISEARKVFVNEFGGTLFTVAKDVKIQVEFNPLLVAGYRLIGYENRLLENKDFNDDTKDAGEIGSGHTVTALYEIIPVGISSPFLKTADNLKYQKTEIDMTGKSQNELMTVKFRYKDPTENTSKLLEKIVLNDNGRLNGTSENFRWSAAVASFSMLLRNSPFSGTMTYEDIEILAMGSIGKDAHGYRNEFLTLVRGMQKLTEATVER